MKFSFKHNFCLDNTFELLFFHTAARQEVEHNKCKHDPNGANTAKEYKKKEFFFGKLFFKLYLCVLRSIDTCLSEINDDFSKLTHAKYTWHLQFSRLTTGCILHHG